VHFFQLWSFENYTSKFRPLLRHKFRAPFLLLPPFFFSYHQGFLWWWASSWLIFSLKWHLLSTLLILHFAAIKIQEAKDYIDEEDPRPTSSNGATSCGIRSSSFRWCSFASSIFLFGQFTLIPYSSSYSPCISSIVLWFGAI